MTYMLDSPKASKACARFAHKITVLSRLNNGWSVFLGRGLDIFQNNRGPFDAKAHRPCRETQITYWKNPDFNARDVAHGSDAPISLKASL